MKTILCAAFAVPVALLAGGVAEASVKLTDSAVFSANGDGHNWLGWIWNTQGAPDDRWNVYYTSPTNPGVFINSGNDASAGIDIDLTPGVHDFLIFGEQPPPTTEFPDPEPYLHFVANLYFGGNQAAPDISGLYGPTCLTVCAASHLNGLDLYGVAPEQEAGTLEYQSGGVKVVLSKFTWAVGDQVDEVSPYIAGVMSGAPDYVGELQLTVTRVETIQLPAGIVLLASGASAFGFLGLRRRRRALAA